MVHICVVASRRLLAWVSQPEFVLQQYLQLHERANYATQVCLIATRKGQYEQWRCCMWKMMRSFGDRRRNGQTLSMLQLAHLIPSFDGHSESFAWVHGFCSVSHFHPCASSLSPCDWSGGCPRRIKSSHHHFGFSMACAINEHCHRWCQASDGFSQVPTLVNSLMIQDKRPQLVECPKSFKIDAPSNIHRKPEAVLLSMSLDQHPHFSPFVVSCDGVPGNEAVLQTNAGSLAKKSGKS